MKVLTKLMVILGIMFGGVVATSPSVAFAACPDGAVVDTKGKWTSAEGTALDAAVAKECDGTADELTGKILRFVKILSALVVVFAVAMIIYGGFKYITSQGDPKSTESAKQQIWFAGIGLFIVLTAFTILQLFMNATGMGS